MEEKMSILPNISKKLDNCKRKSRICKEVRILLSNTSWSLLMTGLTQILSPRGNPGKLSIRMFLEAILHLIRTGEPWRDLPSCFGNWQAVYMRFRRWEKKGIWKELWKFLQEKRFKWFKKVLIDSTIVRAHKHAAGAPKNRGGQKSQALGRSCGGLSTKIHVACLDENTSSAFVLTGGEKHDAAAFELLLLENMFMESTEYAVLDKAYDSQNIRERLLEEKIEPVIPPRKLRKQDITYDKEKYTMRNEVERFFNKIKEFRRIATRYEKLSDTFLAMIHIASAFIVIR